jgi:hypothetical protein
MEDLLAEIVYWGRSLATIRGIVLVGSHARGTARPDSDVDVLCIAVNPDAFRGDGWIPQIRWPANYGTVAGWEDREYGAVWSRHLRLASGLEVELSFGPPSWTDVKPIDPGTREVMLDGHRILYDPDNLLSSLSDALK